MRLGHASSATIILACLAVYVSAYVGLRLSKRLIHVEYTMTSGASMVWEDHRIETAHAVDDVSQRNWPLWMAFWPLHRAESMIWCCFYPMPTHSAFDKDL
jgi:hypothetical protein